MDHRAFAVIAVGPLPRARRIPQRLFRQRTIQYIPCRFSPCRSAPPRVHHKYHFRTRKCHPQLPNCHFITHKYHLIRPATISERASTIGISSSTISELESVISNFTSTIMKTESAIWNFQSTMLKHESAICQSQITISNVRITNLKPKAVILTMQRRSAAPIPARMLPSIPPVKSQPSHPTCT